jgi:hypothetical protein
MEESFEALKERFTIAPILTHFDPIKICIIDTDASDFALGVILSQKDEDGRLHPIAFYSRKFQLAEIIYEVQNKELLAIVDSFKMWYRSLECALKMVMMYNDHQTSSILRQLKYSIGGKPDGPRNWQLTMSKSSTARAPRMENRMLYHSVRSIALETGGVMIHLLTRA